MEINAQKLVLIIFSLFLISFALLYPYSGFAIDNYQMHGSGHKHPITHENQYYIVPSDCENGDNIGKVYEIWTDRRFNDRGGDSYIFEIAGGNTNNSFSIERSTGELMVSNASGIKGDMTLSVKVSIGDDSQLSTVHIKRVNSSDIVYIDSQFSGTSNGSRSAPYKSFKSSGNGNGKAGKYYLYRRGRVYDSDYMMLFNSQNAPKITISSWGKGKRPVLDGNYQTGKFLNLGNVFSSVVETQAAYNVDIMDLHFTNYRDNTLRMTRWGKNINFRRLYFENSESANGLIYLMANVNTSQLYPSDIYIGDIELDSYADRGIKVERGGVVVENIKARTTKLNPKAPVSPTIMPDVMMRYIDAESNGGTGPNLRQYGQHIEWSYFKGFERAIFLSSTANADGSYGPWLLNDNHIRDVIIDGTTTSHGIFFESRPGATNTAENTEITRVVIKNSGKSGIAVSNKVKNVKIAYCLIYDSKEFGIRIDAGTSGTKIHNSIIVDNNDKDILAGSNAELKNSIFTSHSGTINQQNNSSETGFFENKQTGNYRPLPEAPYIKKGNDLGYSLDLDGNKVPIQPTLGTYEYISISEANLLPTVTITAPNANAQFTQGDNVSITATATDSDGTITKVDFYNGNSLLGTDTTSPYSFDWSDVSVGDFTLTAKATDNKGAVTTSDPVTIKVIEKANVAPSVSISGPSANAQFTQGDNVSITATATDSDGTITKVDFYNGTALLGTDTTSPYSFAWSNLSVGNFTLTAKATDNKGAVTTSDPVAITVIEKESGSSTPVAGTGLLEGLVAFYEMNTNLSGTLNDSHGENHGTSTQISHVNGFNEKGNMYDGVSSISTVPHSNSLNLSTEFTLMADIFREGNGQQYRSIIVGKASTNWPENQVYSLAISEDNTIRIRTNIPGIEDWFSTQTVPLKKWVRVIATYKSGEGYSLYFDSTEPEKSPEFSGTIAKSDMELTIGSASLQNNAANSRRFEGVLDNVGIWNRQLSKDEIGELITTKITYPDFGGVEEPNVAPTVSISGPSANAQITQGDNITITADATDTDGTITKVDFYNGNSLLGTDTTSPYSFDWSDVSVGDFTLTAKATDNKGAVTTSDPVAITVIEKANVAPSVSISGPSSNAQFTQGDNISITADATDTDGTITKVDFYNGNSLLGTDTTSPYSFDWSDVSVGDFTLTAKATDNKEAVTTSDPVTIKVIEKANVAPSVSISGPSANAQFTQGDNVSITATATDSDGTITKVDFYNGTALLGTDTTSPYSFAWSNLSVGNFTLTAKATDNKGAVTTSDPVAITVIEKESGSSTPVAGTGLLEGLVAFYEMNTNLSGTLNDSHGENHGTSTQISHVNGFNEKGNMYDGVSSISTVPHSNSLNLSTEFTLMADIFREGDGQQYRSIIVGKASTNWPENQVYSLAISEDNTIRIRTNIPGIEDWFSTQTVPLKKWVRVIATYKSGEGYSLYFDSTEPEKSPEFSGTIAKSDMELTIGSASLQNNAANSRRFEGVLDNVGIWNRQLSKDEIGELITTKITYPDFGGVEEPNVAPTVSISGPSANAQITQGDNITITADATDTDGTITKVDFYNGNSLLGTDTTSPYSFDWSDVSVGDFTLTAKATDNKGAVTTSDPVAITVIEKANVAPSVSISGPSSNAQFTQGDNISITADATDTDGTITKVDFYNGNSLLGTDTTSPYSFDWSDVSVGDFTLTAKATDNKGAVTTSDPVTIKVIEKANVAPSVSISGPSSNAQFTQGDNISITADATDTDGTITKVDFYNGNSLLGTDTTSPYSFDWSDVSVGDFTLTAKATDNKGAVTTSDPVTIKVIEKANVAPSVSISGPSANAQFTQGDNVSITATATDSDGTITKVDFYNGNSLLGTDTTSPYSFAWSNLSVGNFTLTAKATDNKGAVTTSDPVTIKVIEKANVAPSVSISGPSANAQFTQGDNITITADATDTDGTITKVDFYNGNSLLGTDTTSPYSFNWSNLSVGDFTLTAKATDNKGTATVSAAVSINVVEKPNVAPTVTITAPNANAQFTQGDNVSITATAADTDGTITKVDFYNGNSLLGTDTTSPYSFDWSDVSVGDFTLTAKATDNKGAVTTSDPVTIKVIEKANVAPSVSISGPSANAQFNQGDNITITADATDTDGTITKVDFYNGNSLLGTDTTSPYSFNWSDVSVGDFTLTAKATDNRGAVTTSAGVSISVKENETSNEIVIPEVILVTPINNQEFEEGENIELMVMFEGSDESVKEVEYFSGDQLIGSSTVSPFGFTWLNPTIDQHLITAKAIGVDPNKFKISEPVSILVKKIDEKIFQIIDPIKDAVFNKGENITIRVEIPENSKAIMRVDYLRGNTRLGSSITAPYDFLWENSTQGNHDLSAQLIFTDGTKIISEVVPIEVLRKNQAIVKLVSLNNKKEVLPGENLNLNVELLEFENKVSMVEYLLNGKKLGESTTQPYGFTWENIPEGDHQIMARAIEENGLYVYSEPTILSARKDINNIQLEYVIGPNPTTDYLNVIFTNLDGIYDFEFRVVSMNGTIQKTVKARPEGSKLTIDVSDLRNGVYVLQLAANGNNISSKKFIKK